MLRLWRAMHVVGRSSYSEPRLRAFEAYCQTTSKHRAILVCLVFPIPSLVYVIAVESFLPLAPPKKGWAANYNAWIRFAAAAMIVAQSIIMLGRSFIPEFQFPRHAVVGTAITTSVLYIFFSIGLAEIWVYPLPFYLLITTPLCFMALGIGFFIFIDMKPLRSVRDLKFKLLEFFKATCWLATLQIFYPAYTALCNTQTGYRYLAFAVLPTVLRTGMKAILAMHCRAVGQGDQISVVAQLTVEVFHSLYVLNCMQTSSNSARTTAVFILLDLGPNVYHIYRILRGNIQIRSNELTPAPTDSLVGSYVTELHSGKTQSRVANMDARVLPLPNLNSQRAELCRVLLICEYHLVVEYVESFIPFTYMAYLVALYHLPNREYYPHMKTVDTYQALTSIIANVSIFALLEVLSLVFFGFVITKKVGISALHLVAFFLEHQCEMIQSWLFLWVPYCLFFTLQHGGRTLQ